MTHEAFCDLRQRRRRFVWDFPRKGRHAAVGDPAGNEERKPCQIGRDVQGGAVRRDLARQMDADRGQLVVFDPDRGFPLRNRASSRRHSEVAGGTNKCLLEVAHVTPHVSPPARQIENRVRDELPGAVERELAAAIGDAKRDASLEEEVLRHEELAESRVPAHGDDVLVLEEEERLVPARLHARLGLPLKREGRVPGDAAFRKEIDDVDRPGHGRFYPMDSSSLHVPFSSVALTTFTNASPSAPSMGRWSKVRARQPIVLMASEAEPSRISTTFARFSIAPTPLMATCGWLMTGVAKSEPNDPWFVTVNVPPATSSGTSFFARALAARSFAARARPTSDRSSARRMTGTMRPQSSATAMPRFTSR